MALKRVKNSQNWIAQFVVNGRTITRSTGQTDKRKARAVEAELKRQVRLACVQPGAAHKLSEARVAEVNVLETDVSPRAADRVEYALWNFQEWAGDICLNRIDTAMLENYQRKRLKEAAKETVDKELVFIVRMLRRNGYNVQKPKAKPGVRTENRPFTQKEMKAFFEHCPERFRVLFLLMLVTGARPAELIPSDRSSHTALLKSEVDHDQGIVTIRSAKVLPGRRGSVRRVKIQPELVEELKAEVKKHKLKTVFMPVNNLFRYFDKILKAAGIEKVDALKQKLTAHSFRHTCATLMAESVGHNPFVVQHLLGHSQISTTARYCHPTSDAKIIDIGELIGAGSGKVSGKEKPEMASQAS